MDLKLPLQAYVHKFIPKNKFYEKAVISVLLKRSFIEQIQKITWEYKLAESTIGIKGTDAVEEIQIFEIQLKEKVIPKNALKVIDKTIPYPILYIFRYEEHLAYGIMLKQNDQRYYFSEWDEEMHFSFIGKDLEHVYQGIIAEFIAVKKEGENFDSIIETDKQIEILKKEIDRLKNKVRTEKQFNRKVEYNRMLLEKKESLKSILEVNK
ncbi:MAG: hypothetical protein MNSN_02260 [Minisyncoccus archaeiphilus]|uniref:DUF4391 domain-containing protein n=1 Tax=Minisyncoccus archaeiphilus TaxID=3238481 RepID=UPI002B112815|nr:MAG: hypothetical protein MNSN_02260 [Candidatus Parcubacteria bacterium]